MSIHLAEEQLVFFPCGDLLLAGILTLSPEPNGRTVLIPWGGGGLPSSARNRVRARLARELAARGFHAFRFDKPGVGESHGDYQVPDLSIPHTEEIIAASTWLSSQGHVRTVIVANCFGGWSALMAAPSIAGLEGMVVVNAPVRRDHGQVHAGDGSWRWWLKKITRLRVTKLLKQYNRRQYRKQIAAKASALIRSNQSDGRFIDAVMYLLSLRIPTLLMYGNDDFRTDLEASLDNGLRAALEEAGPPSRVVMVDERLEGFGNLNAQDLLVETVISWLMSFTSPFGSRGSAGGLSADQRIAGV